MKNCRLNPSCQNFLLQPYQEERKNGMLAKWTLLVKRPYVKIKRRQMKALRKKMKLLGNEDMDVIAQWWAVISEEIWRKEAAPSAESGEKIITLVRPRLDTVDSSDSGNVRKKLWDQHIRGGNLFFAPRARAYFHAFPAIEITSKCVRRQSNQWSLSQTSKAGKKRIRSCSLISDRSRERDNLPSYGCACGKSVGAWNEHKM